MVDILPVTAAIPCYNAEPFVGDCLVSVSQQTRPPDEIIVVDDASNDGSSDVVEGFSGVRLLRHTERLGPAEARNTALKAAIGDIIVYVDADAVIDRKCIAALLQQHRLGADGAGALVVETNVASPWDEWRRRYAWMYYDVVVTADWLYGICCSYRRDVLLSVGGFDPVYSAAAGEDVDLGFRLRAAGHALVYTPEAVVYHQRRDTLRSLLRQQRSWTYWGALALLRQSPASTHRWLGWKHLGATVLLIGGMTLKRSIRDLGRGDVQIGLVHWLIWVERVRAVIKALRDSAQFRAQ